MLPSAFAAVPGPVTGSTAPAKGGRTESRPVGDDADFATALSGATAEAPALAAPAKTSRIGSAGSVSEGGETETGAAAPDSFATVPEAAPSLPGVALPIPVPEAPATVPSAASVSAGADAGTDGAGTTVPVSDIPADEVPAAAPITGKPLAASGDGDVVIGADQTAGNEAETPADAPATRGADKSAIDKAAQAVADQLVAGQKVVAPPASDRAREVAALQSAVLTPARPARSAGSAEPAPATVEAVEPIVERDEAVVAAAPETPAEPVRVRDVIDRAVTRTDAATKASDAELAAPVVSRSADAPATPSTSSAQPKAETPAQPIAPLVSAEEPTTTSPAPAAPNTPESRAAEAAETLGLSTLSRTTVETTAQIAAQIVRKLEGRSTRFEMALTPDGLGRVDISLDIEADGALRATLAFDNPVAATDLRGRADELRRQLLDAGFTLADDALSFAERDPAAGQGGGFDRSADRHNARAFGAASRLSADADLSAQPARWVSLSLTPAGVDMKV